MLEVCVTNETPSLTEVVDFDESSLTGPQRVNIQQPFLVAGRQLLGLAVLLLQVLLPVVLDNLVNVSDVASADVARAVRLESPASRKS